MVGIRTGGIRKVISAMHWPGTLAAAITLLFALVVARFRMTKQLVRQSHGLSDKERFFQSLIEKSFDAVVILSEDATVSYASPAFERMTGHATEAVIGRSIYDFMLPDDRDIRIEKAFHDNPGRIVRSRFVHRTGEVWQIEAAGRNMVHDSAIRGIVVNLRDVSERVAAEHALMTSRGELRDLSRRSESALQDERLRISREVHDDLGQYVTALGLDVQSLRNHASDTDTNARNERLDAMAELVTAAARSVRQIARQLRVGAIDGAGLSDAVSTYAREFAKRAGVDIVTDIRPGAADVPREVVSAVLGILHEALTNVARHSRATRVFVKLCIADGQMHLAVADNGAGFSTGNGGAGLGIVSMGERARACNGTLTARTRKSGGVFVQATFPL